MRRSLPGPIFIPGRTEVKKFRGKAEAWHVVRESFEMFVVFDE